MSEASAFHLQVQNINLCYSLFQNVFIQGLESVSICFNIAITDFNCYLFFNFQ